MAVRHLLREMFRRRRPNAAVSSGRGILTEAIYGLQHHYATATATNGENCEKEKHCDQWLILPPFRLGADGCFIGKKLYGQTADTNMTALKWILKCCPHLPRCLVQKLFRLRQIRKECFNVEAKEQRPRRDPAIIVINKPPGLPVQGGIGIKRSLDELAAKYLRYDYRESPRLT